MTRPTGVFVVSLDFELDWGVRDKLPLATYGDNLRGVRTAVPALLRLFERHDIHATWATVGFLFFNTRRELLDGLPRRMPAYVRPELSSYSILDTIGEDEDTDPFHYAPSLLDLIRARPHQDVGTHTFSHYYCLEPGQDVEDFRADLRAALRVAERRGVRLESLVFPRNQCNPAYLDACRELGIATYRGNPSSWLYRGRSEGDETLPRRALRLLDAYVNLSSHNGHALEGLRDTAPTDVPASRFLRPYSRHLRCLEPLRLRRITGDLTHAAEHGLLYHLWWHPHNFGVDQERNIAFLAQILDHFAGLRNARGMESLTMGELGRRLRSEVP